MDRRLLRFACSGQRHRRKPFQPNFFPRVSDKNPKNDRGVTFALFACAIVVPFDRYKYNSTAMIEKCLESVTNESAYASIPIQAHANSCFFLPSDERSRRHRDPGSIGA